ncbi:unnamed protein product [Strongylus vulgaris]|uniref:SKA complex subunit 1 n=1 Tax=Strongylus vulgaris TaxID=40348 RepID=A0A3P7KCP6_STRVU|nr:unnamed protein product [Strongylus vulgaris]
MPIGLRSFNEKLNQLQQLIRECSLLKTELDQISPLEHVFVGIGDVLRKENILVEYPCRASPELPAKSTSLETDIVQAIRDEEKQAIPSDPPKEPKSSVNCILLPVSTEEFEEIPKYMRGRMTCAELNEIVLKLDEFLSQKRRLLNAPFKKLSMKEKDQVTKWKEQETACTSGKLFCQEVDVKPMLSDRARTLFRSAAPCLRHVRRIREKMSDEKYEIKRILAERKIDGKSDRMEYLVDWEPTWVFDSDMDANLLDDFHYSVVVLGPIHTPENLQKKSIKEMDIVVQR